MITLRLLTFRLMRAAVGLALAAPTVAFSNVSVGSVIDNTEMITLEGTDHPLLGTERANVFLFFRPDQERSREVLKEIALLAREFAEKSVGWVTIVSDRYASEEVRAVVEDAGLEIPVLIDEQDALVGKLGVHLHPVAGVTDQDHILKAYQHYQKINFIDSLRAYIRHVIGEISDAELEKKLHPPKIERSDNGAAARRNLKLAQMLFKAGNLQKALEIARKSLEYDPEQAEAQALVGAVLAAQGDCPGALLAFEQALGLDPNEPTAREGRKACQSGS